MHDAKHGRKLICQLFCLLPHLFLHNTGHQNVFPDRQPVQEHKVLKYKPDLRISDPCQFLLIHPCQLHATQPDVSFVKGNITGNTV